MRRPPFSRAFSVQGAAKSDIEAFEKESTKNDAAGSYAKEALPTLRKHLQAAESLQSATTGRRTR